MSLALTQDNVETVLDELRPYLMADGGNVELAEIEGPIVKLRLQGACGSCPNAVYGRKFLKLLKWNKWFKLFGV